MHRETWEYEGSGDEDKPRYQQYRWKPPESTEYGVTIAIRYVVDSSSGEGIIIFVDWATAEFTKDVIRWRCLSINAKYCARVQYVCTYFDQA